MKISLENWLRNKLQENEEMHDYAVSTDTIRSWIDEYKELQQPSNKLESSFGSSYSIYQGTEFNNENLDLLIVVNFELKKINKIDLENKVTKIIDIPENGIPIHFKKISKSRFNELIEKYLFT